MGLEAPMTPVRLALMWHQHQPIYADPMTGQPALPWVRLHAIKDYWGMARLLELVPEMRLTINLVPSLLQQIDAYADGSAADPHQVIGGKMTDDLSETEVLFLLDNFFSANRDTMIRPLPRYAELFEMRDLDRLPAAEARPRFGPRDLRDLAVLYDLVWFHPFLREEDDTVRALWEKGADFTEEDKRSLHAKEREILSRVIGMHKRLSDAGALELTTTPCHHPILPLLIDFGAINEALPDALLPASRRTLGDDARIQVAAAIESHTKRFGVPPRGMWPPEGALSERTALMLAKMGVDWIASDEEVLERSIGVPLGRSGPSLDRGDVLYRPYRIESGDAPLRMVFRDHYLSDLIGFHYRSRDGRGAAEDFLDRVRSIGSSWRGEHPPVVTVILDGENAWEHYPSQGVDFLRALYEGAVKDRDAIIPVSVSDAIAGVPAGTLDRVYAGSWIDHNLYIWGGHEEDRAAWDLLYRCRAALDAHGVEPESQARNELRIAQGSDWFWWFGDDHTCADDGVFDRLFRSHIRAAYEKAGLHAPPEIERPIKQHEKRRAYSDPTAIVTASVNGLVDDYFEWLGAGKVEEGDPLGVMDLPRSSAIKLMAFGGDASNLYLRVDFRCSLGPRSAKMSVRVVIVEPVQTVIRIELEHGTLVPIVETGGAPVGAAALDRILEVAVPWASIPAAPHDCVEFFVQRLEENETVERSPREGAVALTVPSEDDVAWDWSV
jgi:alpha-amylase/alpha-mannosidase (GH57 family)